MACQQAQGHIHGIAALHMLSRWDALSARCRHNCVGASSGVRLLGMTCNSEPYGQL